VRFGCIRAHERPFDIRMMCRVMDVSVSGYYRWRGRPPAPRASQDAELLVRLREHHHASRQTYGRLRLRAALRNDGIRVSGKRVRRLMRLGGITVFTRRRYKATTNSKHGLPVAENVVERTFDVEAIGRADRYWAGDITYIGTREGWLYLAVILDLFSRRVIGWSMRSEMTAGLVIDAFVMALRRRRPPRGLIAHSDRGSQYASRSFQRVLRDHGVVCSMSRKGDCWDNAVVESFNATIKTELIHRYEWETRDAARTAVYEFIETWYNARRLHSTLGYLSPITFEAQHTATAA
jgi:putative transposase